MNKIPSGTPPKNPEDIQKGLEEILRYVQEAETRVQRGESVDLAGMDEKVAAICMAIEQSDPETGKNTEALLADLVEKLDGLANAIKTQVDQMKDQSGGEGGA